MIKVGKYTKNLLLIDLQILDFLFYVDIFKNIKVFFFFNIDPFIQIFGFSLGGILSHLKGCSLTFLILQIPLMASRGRQADNTNLSPGLTSVVLITVTHETIQHLTNCIPQSLQSADVELFGPDVVRSRKIYQSIKQLLFVHFQNHQWLYLMNYLTHFIKRNNVPALNCPHYFSMDQKKMSLVTFSFLFRLYCKYVRTFIQGSE